MSKVILLVFVALVASLPAVASAENLRNWQIDITINEDGSADEKVLYEYNESVYKSDYFVFADISDVRVYSGESALECTVKKDVGSLVSCDNINASRMTYEFRVDGYITRMNELYVFKYKFPVTQVTDRFSVNVKLPLGSVLADKSKLTGTSLRPFEPSYGLEGTDGRQIFIKWELTNPKLGETVDASIIFEKVGTPGIVILGVSIVFVIIVALVIVLVFFKKSYRQILPILTDSERSVMNMIIKNKKVDQRRIVRETDYSKAKVSRIIKNLEERGLVRRISKGRTNIIVLCERAEAKKQENS